MEPLTDMELQFLGLLLDCERNLMYEDTARHPVDVDLRARVIERCNIIIEKLGGAELLGVDA